MSDLSAALIAGERRLRVAAGDVWRHFKGAREPPADWNQSRLDPAGDTLGCEGSSQCP